MLHTYLVTKSGRLAKQKVDRWLKKSSTKLMVQESECLYFLEHFIEGREPVSLQWCLGQGNQI